MLAKPRRSWTAWYAAATTAVCTAPAAQPRLVPRDRLVPPRASSAAPLAAPPPSSPAGPAAARCHHPPWKSSGGSEAARSCGPPLTAGAAAIAYEFAGCAGPGLILYRHLPRLSLGDATPATKTYLPFGFGWMDERPFMSSSPTRRCSSPRPWHIPQQVG